MGILNIKNAISTLRNIFKNRLVTVEGIIQKTEDSSMGKCANGNRRKRMKKRDQTFRQFYYESLDLLLWTESPPYCYETCTFKIYLFCHIKWCISVVNILQLPLYLLSSLLNNTFIWETHFQIVHQWEFLNSKGVSFFKMSQFYPQPKVIYKSRLG